MKTNRPLSLNFQGKRVLIPKGSEVVCTHSGMGLALYAVASVELLARQTGDRHQAEHYYCFVPVDAVDLPSLEEPSP